MEKLLPPSATMAFPPPPFSLLDIISKLSGPETGYKIGENRGHPGQAGPEFSVFRVRGSPTYLFDVKFPASSTWKLVNFSIENVIYEGHKRGE